MSYTPQNTPRTDAEKMPKQGTQPQGNQQPSQTGNKPQDGNVQGFPQQKPKAGDGPANNPDDSQQPKENTPTKASNVA